MKRVKLLIKQPDRVVEESLLDDVEQEIQERIKMAPEPLRAEPVDEEDPDDDQGEEDPYEAEYQALVQASKMRRRDVAHKRFGTNKRRVGKPTADSLPIYNGRIHPKQIYRMRLLGMSDAQIADVLMISRKTLYMWRIKHLAVTQAWTEGDIGADATVANALFKRAVGYQHSAEKISIDAKSGGIVRAPYTEKFAPDTTAAIFWLTNRQGRLWKQKHTQENVGADGQPLAAPVINVFPVVSAKSSAPVIDYDAIDAVDAAEEERVKLLGQEVSEEDEEDTDG